jgi:hypothetical protein
MPDLACSNCSGGKPAFWQCAEPNCSKISCQDCVLKELGYFKKLLTILSTMRREKGDAHPSVGCPTCGSTIKLIA